MRVLVRTPDASIRNLTALQHPAQPPREHQQVLAAPDDHLLSLRSATGVDLTCPGAAIR
jgi:hypothetical protein